MHFACEPVVRADPDRLRQVLLHLLDNAVKYTAADTTVTIRTDIDESAETAVILVHDEGPGIPAEKAEEAFAPYRRLYTRTPSQDPGGTGLGLAIARSLTELMGGTVTIDADAGNGATLRVRLPLSRSPAHAPTD
jgi:signal transduction histidine kinase